MSNLLPREAQKARWSMYRARFIIAGSLVALAVAALCALALLPSYLALHPGLSTGDASSAPEKVADAKDREAIRRIQSLLGVLSPLVAATTTPTSAITQALSLRPLTVKINHIVYTRGSEGTIMLVGSSAAREAINGYRQALAADPLFKTVSIPVGDLTGAPGGQFSLSLSGDF